MNQSESVAALAAALCDAQAELENVVKDAKNPHFRSDYATLAAIRDAVFPVFTKHGLSIVQMVGYADGVVTVETQLMHSSGEWLRSTAGAPAPKQDPQGVGSACTYLRRYSLAALAGLAQADDDGNAASDPSPKAGYKPTARSEYVKRESDGEPWLKPLPFGKNKGKLLGDLDEATLRSTIKWCEETDAMKFGNLIEDCRATLERARG